jgi:hypothetical protein
MPMMGFVLLTARCPLKNASSKTSDPSHRPLEERRDGFLDDSLSEASFPAFPDG